MLVHWYKSTCIMQVQKYLHFACMHKARSFVKVHKRTLALLDHARHSLFNPPIDPPIGKVLSRSTEGRKLY